MSIWLTHLYEYGLPHAGIGSLPYTSLLEVEHFLLVEDDEERGSRTRAKCQIFDVIGEWVQRSRERGWILQREVEYYSRLPRAKGRNSSEPKSRPPAHFDNYVLFSDSILLILVLFELLFVLTRYGTVLSN